jgi:preprotein translocase SecE subunit
MSEEENEVAGAVPQAPAVRRDRKPSKSSGGENFVGRTTHFLRDTRAEMRRVSWPGAKEVQNTTIITLIAVIFFALYLFSVDRVLAYAIDHLFTWMGGRT